MIYTTIISLLIEKQSYLLRPQSFSFQIVSEFIDIFGKFFYVYVPRCGAFDSLFCPEGRVFTPRGRDFAPFKSCPGGGGMVLDEIDTCISHTEFIPLLQNNDHYKLLRKHKNVTHLEEIVTREASAEKNIYVIVQLLGQAL